jgi:phosphomannomutase
VVAEVCRRLPGEHFLINQKIDGTFPAHHPDPTVEKNLEQLKTLVAAQNCDIGLAFDGDGDRIGVIDGQGRVMWGDQLMVVLAGEILSRKPGSVIIADVKASQVFFDEIERMGGKPVMWKTGHSLIKSKMQETGAPLAGEMSAHIFFSDGYYGYDDAVYAAIRLLSIIGTGDESLSDIMDRLPQMLNTPELRFDCDEARKFQVVEEVAERLKTVEGITVHDIDGVRVQSDDGWWLLRASNTQAVLVARCESTTEEGLKRLKSTLTDQLIASGLEAPDFT